MNRVIICANKKLPLLFVNYCDSYLGNGFSKRKCENCDHLKKCLFWHKIVVPLGNFQSSWKQMSGFKQVIFKPQKSKLEVNSLCFVGITSTIAKESMFPSVDNRSLDGLCLRLMYICTIIYQEREGERGNLYT